MALADKPALEANGAPSKSLGSRAGNDTRPGAVSGQIRQDFRTAVVGRYQAQLRNRMASGSVQVPTEAECFDVRI
jgi:hypothetical protein